MRAYPRRIGGIVMMLACVQAAANPGLRLQVIDASTLAEAAATRAGHPGPLPHSWITHGRRDIAAAWLDGATGRYPHGVLGDDLEGSALAVRSRDGQVHRLTLPGRRVFEDLRVRLADLDDDGRDEMLVVESDADEGASLAVLGLRDGGIRLLARSPFIGTRFRWLNPLGVGDFDGDGRADVALVRTPHIGGVLEIYRYTPPALTLIARRTGISTHAMGSTALDLGTVLPRAGGDLILAPDQRRRRLLLLSLSEGELQPVAEVALPGALASGLVPLDGPDPSLDGRRFTLRTTDGARLLLHVEGLRR
jgi:hypothetical protein